METMETLVIKEIRESISVAVRAKLTSYCSPLNTLIEDAIKHNDAEIRKLLNSAVSSATNDTEFCNDVRTQIRHKLARELVNCFGESIFKKTIDSMKSDPTVKARCVLAVESIVEDALNKKASEGAQ